MQGDYLRLFSLQCKNRLQGACQRPHFAAQFAIKYNTIETSNQMQLRILDKDVNSS